jgi:hypothetical protein
MALKPQPDERLDELVSTEQQRDPRQRQELAALADMANSIDADRADHHAADDVSLRRETHGPQASARALVSEPSVICLLPGSPAPLRYHGVAEFRGSRIARAAVSQPAGTKARASGAIPTGISATL